MTAYDFFAHYWWLAFPLMALVSYTVRIFTCNSYHRERLQILKSYADKGQPVPESLRRELY